MESVRGADAELAGVLRLFRGNFVEPQYNNLAAERAANAPPVEVTYTAMVHRMPLFFLAAFATFAAFGQKYDGPPPPKPDIPYLKHASELVATEAVEAKEQKKKDESLYTIEGANSPAKTPLAEPVFIFQSDKIVPDSLQLFKLESKSGHREILMSRKGPQPIRMDVTRLGGNVYKLEVDESLEPGEYSLSPANSNKVFCFAVF